jgi:integrase
MGARLQVVGGTKAAGIEPARKRPAKPRGNDRLTDRAIAAAKPGPKTRKLSDGKGLYLAVMPSGAKLWRIKYRHGTGNKRVERTYSIGDYREVSIAQAREARKQAREWLRAGLDPVLEKRVQDTSAATAQATSFADVAAEWLSKQQFSDDHRDATRRRLDNNLLESLGKLPVASIKPVVVLETLRRIERRGRLETAAKCRQLCGQIFRYAIQTSRAESDPAANLRGAIKPPKKESRATIPRREMPNLFAALRKVPSELVTKLALGWVMLTACRTGEMRGATWDEIEDGNTWRIPAERMKMDREHVVPLSTQAQAILKRARELRQSDEPDALIFPGFTRHGGLSENALLALLARAGYFGRQTTHGFRASFSTWSHEVAEADPDVIEACLAHTKEGVRGKYNRASYLSKRRALLQSWATQLEQWGWRLP